MNSITTQEIVDQMENGIAFQLIDVRSPTEYQKIHAQPASLQPLDSLNPKAIIEKHGEHSTIPIYLICKTGARAGMAWKKFQQEGYENVFVVEGGTEGWQKNGLSVVEGKPTMSLERQVRIAAGSLILLGCILSLIVNTTFIALSIFVGAGLVFAGLTDTCGMAMLLAKMPWNQTKQPFFCDQRS